MENLDAKKAETTLKALETKLEALENRMDYMLNECATEDELKPYYDQWCSLQDYINQLKKELQK